MIPISPLTLRAAFAAGALAVAFGGGWLIRGWRADAALARVEQAHAEVVAEAERKAREHMEAVRAREAAMVQKSEEIARDAQSIVEALQRDTAAAGAASRSMLDAASRAARRCGAAAGPAAAGPGSSAGMPGGMRDGDRLLRVLTELDGAAGAYADAADRARAAGSACERTYDAARAAMMLQP